MKYRRFGKLGWEVSALGFGCMRLPVIGEDRSNIDEAEATRMIRHAIDNGVNYVDSAYGYHGGNSERVLGRALMDGYREKVKVATKLPPHLVKTEADFDNLLNEQLEKLQVSFIDCYLLHSMNADRFGKLQSLGVLPWAERARADGRIAHLGFSFHGSYKDFERVLGATDMWDFCQIQYNYMNEDVQAGTKGFELAAKKGIGIVIMEPILGGNLSDPPEAVRQLWDSAGTNRSPAEWALQWLWNKPEVSVVLSGMTEMRHVTENLASADRSRPGILSADELRLITKVRDTYGTLRPIPCTKCEYCMPCPSGVNIPRNLDLHNIAVMYNQFDRSRRMYQNMKEEMRAGACTACLECEKVCPQEITVSEWMEKIDKGFDAAAS